MKPSPFQEYKIEVDRAYREEGLTMPNQIYNRLKIRLGATDKETWNKFKCFVRNRVNRVLKGDVGAHDQTKTGGNHKGVQTESGSSAAPKWKFEEGQQVTVRRGKVSWQGKVIKRKVSYIIHYDNFNDRHDELLPQERLQPLTCRKRVALSRAVKSATPQINI